MSNEDFERQMEFIDKQQAQFSSDIEQLKDIVARLANATLSRFEALEEKSAKRYEEMDEKIAALIDSQVKTEDNARITSENLKNLTTVVDKYFRNLNGKSEG